MPSIGMTAEIRTDYDCEVLGLPAHRWAEAVFNIRDQEIVLEISVEKEIIVALMAGEDAVWKGTLAGLKAMLKAQLKAKP